MTTDEAIQEVIDIGRGDLSIEFDLEVYEDKDENEWR
jgi:hypothetical protein